MARPNPERTLEVEPILAARIQSERESRGLTYEALAKLMTDAGCPIQPSAIQKIEKSGRRIVVDEALAFSIVFDIPIADLLTPRWVHYALLMRQDLTEGPRQRHRMTTAQSDYAKLVERVVAYLIAEGIDNDLWAAFEAKAEEHRKHNGDSDSLTWSFRQDVMAFYEQMLKVQKESPDNG